MLLSEDDLVYPSFYSVMGVSTSLGSLRTLVLYEKQGALGIEIVSASA